MSNDGSDIVLPFRKPGAPTEAEAPPEADTREEVTMEIILTPEAVAELQHFNETLERARQGFSESQQIAALSLYALHGAKNALDQRVATFAQESINDEARALLSNLKTAPRTVYIPEAGKIVLSFPV